MLNMTIKNGVFYKIVLALFVSIVFWQPQALAIKNGEIVRGNEYSSVVGIFSDSSKELCSGVFVTPRLILTAGHCIQWFNKTVEIFTRRLSDSRVVRIAKKNAHPMLVVGEAPYDFGYMLLDYSVSSSIVPIQVKKPNSQIQFDHMMAVGFSERIKTKNLYKGTVEFQPSFLKLVSQVQGVGICGGDSGGAIIDQTENRLLGIIAGKSADQECEEGYSVGFASITANFLDWVEKETGIQL